jgi:ribonuclease P protein component
VLRCGHRRSHQDLVIFTTNDQKSGSKNKALAISDHKPDQWGSRLGITASRKVGGAVVRNKFKRRVRSWFRARRLDFTEDVDLIVIARPSGAQLSFDQLDQRLSRLMGLSPLPILAETGLPEGNRDDQF